MAPKHIVYPTIARPMTIGGIPRVALGIAGALTMPFLVVFAIALNPIASLAISAVIFGVLWLIMKIISLNDPDAILIAALRAKSRMNKGDRYAA